MAHDASHCRSHSGCWLEFVDQSRCGYYVGLRLAVTLSGSRGNWTRYGTGCVSSWSSTPSFGIRPGQLPTVGQRLGMQVTTAPPLSPGVLLLGASRAHLDLGRWGAPGCLVLTSADLPLVDAWVDATGSATVDIPIPPNDSLLGARFCGQFAIIDFHSTLVLPIVVSDAGEMTIGV